MGIELKWSGSIPLIATPPNEEFLFRPITIKGWDVFVQDYFIYKESELYAVWSNAAILINQLKAIQVFHKSELPYRASFTISIGIAMPKEDSVALGYPWGKLGLLVISPKAQAKSVLPKDCWLHGVRRVDSYIEILNEKYVPDTHYYLPIINERIKAINANPLDVEQLLNYPPVDVINSVLDIEDISNKYPHLYR